VARIFHNSQSEVKVDDGFLIALAKQGDRMAYDRLVRRYHGFVRLKASSYFLAGGDSEDLIQEGLVGLYKAIRDYRTDREISSEELRSLVGCLSTALSELESRVLSLYLDGCSYEQVGERLGCDTKTVDNALQRVKRKVGAHLRTRLVAS